MIPPVRLIPDQLSPEQLNLGDHSGLLLEHDRYTYGAVEASSPETKNSCVSFGSSHVKEFRIVFVFF